MALSLPLVPRNVNVFHAIYFLARNERPQHWQILNITVYQYRYSEPLRGRSRAIRYDFFLMRPDKCLCSSSEGGRGCGTVCCCWNCPLEWHSRALWCFKSLSVVFLGLSPTRYLVSSGKVSITPQSAKGDLPTPAKICSTSCPWPCPSDSGDATLAILPFYLKEKKENEKNCIDQMQMHFCWVSVPISWPKTGDTAYIQCHYFCLHLAIDCILNLTKYWHQNMSCSAVVLGLYKCQRVHCLKSFWFPF